MSGVTRWVVIAGAAWIALVMVCIAIERGTGNQLPTCAFKRITGVPCAACGSTRALQALSRGEFVAAIALNPLMTCLVLLTPIALASWSLRKRRGRSESTNADASLRVQQVAFFVGICAVALNWAWVIHRGG